MGETAACVKASGCAQAPHRRPFPDAPLQLLPILIGEERPEVAVCVARPDRVDSSWPEFDGESTRQGLDGGECRCGHGPPGAWADHRPACDEGDRAARSDPGRGVPAHVQLPKNLPSMNVRARARSCSRNTPDCLGRAASSPPSRLPRDYYVRLDSIDLSLDLGVIGRRVEVVASPDRVRARHPTLTDPRALARRPGAVLRVAAGGCRWSGRRPGRRCGSVAWSAKTTHSAWTGARLMAPAKTGRGPGRRPVRGSRRRRLTGRHRGLRSGKLTRLR
jgi:hypothetical protein